MSNLKHDFSNNKPIRQRNILALDPKRMAKNFVAFQPGGTALERLVRLATARIPGMASFETIKKIVSYNPQCVWGVGRKDPEGLVDLDNPEGLFAYLPLTELGFEGLMNDQVPMNDPPLEAICAPLEQPAALYFWGIYMPGRLAGAISLFTEILQRPEHRDLPFLTRAATPEAERMFSSIGFNHGVFYGGQFRDDLMIATPYGPAKEAREPSRIPYDREASEENDIKIEVVSSLDDLSKIWTVRSITYMEENGDPYYEEFDYNDLCSVHILATQNGEPAGAIRLRFFKDFAKVERLSVRKKWRNSRLAFDLVKAAIAFSKKKGFAKFYGHSAPRLVKFWQRFGFEVVESKGRFRFAGSDFVAIKMELDDSFSHITIEDDPFLIMRPEGKWHKKGPFDYAN